MSALRIVSIAVQIAAYTLCVYAIGWLGTFGVILAIWGYALQTAADAERDATRSK